MIGEFRSTRLALETDHVNKRAPNESGARLISGGADGTRTRDLRRDRPAF